MLCASLSLAQGPWRAGLARDNSGASRPGQARMRAISASLLHRALLGPVARGSLQKVTQGTGHTPARHERSWLSLAASHSRQARAHGLRSTPTSPLTSGVPGVVT